MSYVLYKDKYATLDNKYLWEPPYVPPLWTGLIHYWSIDESIGMSTYDIIGDMDASLGSGMKWGVGKRGKSAECYDYTSAITLNQDGSNGGMNLQEFSLNQWVYSGYDSNSYGYWTYYNVPYGKYYFTVTNLSPMWPSNYITNLRISTNFGGTNYTVDMSVGLSPNTWYMHTFTFNKGIITSYKNATLMKQDTTKSGQSIKYDYPNLVYPTAGGSGATGGSGWVRGTRWDEIGYWNRELTQADINTLYNAGAGYFY